MISQLIYEHISLQNTDMNKTAVWYVCAVKVDTPSLNIWHQTLQRQRETQEMLKCVFWMFALN